MINKIIKKVIFVTVLLLTTTIGMFADQTWDQETAARETYYFLVPSKLTVISTGTPTDFYVSYLSEELEWVKTSKVYGWGTPQQPFTLEWTPDYPISNTSLGIHTAPRNSTDFSSEPTDLTDTTVNVIFASGDFNNTFSSYTFYENYSLYFNYIPNTLPNKLLLEVTYDGIIWASVKEVFLDNSGQSKIDFFNDIVKEAPVRLRLTYDHEIGKMHNIAITNWIGYSKPDFIIRNKLKLESTSYSDNDIIDILFAKNNLLNERSFVQSYLVFGFDTLDLGRITPTQMEQPIYVLSILKKNDFEGIVKLLYYSAWGELLNSAEILIEDKYFTMNQYKKNLPLGGEVVLNWSNSNHFRKVRIYESSVDFGPDSFYVIAKDWDIKKDYKVIKNNPGTFYYRFLVEDNVNELTVDIGPITWSEMYVCPEDSLNQVIDSLKREINIIKSDSVLVEILYDVTNSILYKETLKISGLEQLNVVDDVVYKQIEYDIQQVYLNSIIGSIVPLDIKGNIVELDVTNYANGLYFIHVVTKNKEIKTYKFIR